MKSLLKLFILIVLSVLTQCQSASHPSKWSEKKLNEWFETGSFLNGFPIIPDMSIDRRIFAEHYYENKESWDKVFSFLKNTDLSNTTLGRIELGDNIYLTVSEYYPRGTREPVLFEAHQNYIDLFYVVFGKEIIYISPSDSMTVTQPYNSETDVVWGTVSEFSALIASPDRFFVVFPYKAHRPGVRDGNDSVFVRRIVVKIPFKSDMRAND